VRISQGDIGMQSVEVAKANPAIRTGAIRSWIPSTGPTRMWCRSRDPQKLAQAKRELEKMLERVRRAQSNSSWAL
jgi:hypothetical protein